MQSTGAAAACGEKARLARAYSFAASDYLRSAMVLHERVGVMSKQEYEAIRAFAEKARLAAGEARMELENHIAGHGC